MEKGAEVARAVKGFLGGVGARVVGVAAWPALGLALGCVAGVMYLVGMGAVPLGAVVWKLSGLVVAGAILFGLVGGEGRG